MSASRIDLGKRRTVQEIVFKYMIIFAFYFLPRKVTETFVFLCIMSMLKLCRPTLNTDYIIDTVMFQRLLDVNYIEDITIVPSKSIKCFWGDEFMNKPVFLDGRHFLMKEVICDTELSKKHKNVIIDQMLGFLPKSMYRKLHLGESNKRQELTNDFSELFVL